MKEGRKRRHYHVGDLEKLSDKWNSKACLDYVNNLCDGTFLNFSHLARTFGLKEIDCKQKDKGQIGKEFVKSGVDIEKFDYHAKLPENGVNICKKKLKLYNCNRVSVPMDVTNENITKSLISEIQGRKYSLGELIVPIKFKKISVSKDGDLTEDYIC